MSINIPSPILGLKGQCVNTINCNEYTNTITISCKRDKRFTPIDPVTESPGTSNCYVRRVIHDVPLLDYRLQIEIELAQYYPLIISATLNVVILQRFLSID